MFVGHYSAAFLAKRIAPDIPLPVYFLVCQTIDLFWAMFVLLGVEKVRYVENITATNSLDLYFMPFTHSLPGAFVWAGGIAALYWLFNSSNPDRKRNTILFGAVVLSHWFFDFLAHRPDLPLWYDSFKVGLGLWNFRLFELLLELALVWGSIIVALKVVGGSRTHYLVLGLAMTALQIVCVVRPTPQEDHSIALLLLACYAALTLLSVWTDKKRPVPAVVTI